MCNAHHQIPLWPTTKDLPGTAFLINTVFGASTESPEQHVSKYPGVQVQRRAVEESLASVQTQLEGSKAQWQVLRQHHEALMQRLDTLRSTPHCEESFQNVPEHQPHVPPAAAPAADDACNLALPTASSSGGARVPHYPRNASRHTQLVYKRSSSNIWGDSDRIYYSARSAAGVSKWDIPQPISATAYCAPISYALVSKYMLPRKLWQASGSNGVVQAISDYQHSVTQALQSSDICWFCQYPSPTFCLSYSTGAPYLLGLNFYSLFSCLRGYWLFWVWRHTRVLGVYLEKLLA